MDLTIDEVTTISSIIQEAAGEEAEIIFGAVHDSSMEGAVRVTVIATGFEAKESATAESEEPRYQARSAVGGAPRPVVRPPSPPPTADSQRRLDLHIPAFIRRQMD
jgi:cell division protein FtsZ